MSGMPIPVIGREEAITQRPISNSILGVDSQDRYTNYVQQQSTEGLEEKNPYNFTITRSNNIFTGTFTRIAVSEIMLPWVLPNINFYTNTIVATTRIYGPIPFGPPTPVASATITLPIGFYTPSMLATALQTAVRNAGLGLPNFTMTYGQPTGTGNQCIFEYSALGALPNPNNVVVAFEPITYEGRPTQRQLFDMLGFRATNRIAQTGWKPAGTAVYGAGPVIAASASLAIYTKFVNIVCTQLTQNQGLKDASTNPVVRDMLARVYISGSDNQQNIMPSSASFAPPGTTPFTIYKDFNTPKQILWRQDQPVPGVLQFQLFDDGGNSLDDVSLFGIDTTDWCMTLLVSEN